MAIDQSRTGRRAILVAGVGGAAALAARALGGPDAARAANLDPVVIGAQNTGSLPTILENDGTAVLTADHTAFIARNTSGDTAPAIIAEGGVGVQGTGLIGVVGSGSSVGLRGTGTGAGSGLEAVSSAGPAVLATSTGNIGVSAGSLTREAVHAEGVAGVVAIGSTGTGVAASSTSGLAIDVSGKARFSRSGVGTIPSGSDRTTVSGVALTAASKILVTLQSDPGRRLLKFVAPNVSASSFDVVLNGNANGGIGFAWFVID